MITKSKRSTTSISRELCRLSIPLVGTQLANIALSTTDTLVMGNLSIAALAGGGLAVIWFNQIRTMVVGLLTPLGNRIAQKYACYEVTVQNNDSGAASELAQEIRILTRDGLFLAVAGGLVGGALLVGIGYLLPLFGQSESIVKSAFPMMWALAPGLIPCLMFQVSRQFTVGLGKPKSLLMITLGMVVLNLILNLCLAFGIGPIPALGVVGVGIATSMVHLVSAVIFLWKIFGDETMNRFHALDFWHFNSSSLIKQLRLGIPVALSYGAEAGMFSILAMVMGTFGDEALAAHNVVYQVTFIVFQIGVGFSHGASILISRFLGFSDFEAIKATANRVIVIMTSIVASFALLFYLVPKSVVVLFLEGESTKTIEIAVSLLLIGAVMEFVDTGQNLAIGVLRGLNDTKTSLFVSLIGYWVIGLPVTFSCLYLIVSKH